MNPMRAELSRILEATTILSPEAFEFAGREFGANEPYSGPAEPSAGRRKPPRIQKLQRCLYWQCYVSRFHGAYQERAWNADEPSSITEELAAASDREPTWDTDWVIDQVGSAGDIVARKNGAARRFLPGTFLTGTGPGNLPKVKGIATVFVPPGSNDLQEDYYHVFGEAVNPQEEHYQILRFYWNVTAEGAAHLFHELASRLNRFQVPFTMKCVNDGQLFYRADAAVLYVNKRFYPIAAMVIADVYESVRRHLEADTPLFTRPLAPGLAFAEDPQGESFGMNRCGLLAEAMWRSYAKGHSTTAQRLRQVAAHFRARRVSLDRPWLNPGNTIIDPYQFPFEGQ